MAYTSWRLNISASQAGGNIAIGEIEMRATPGGADQCTGGTAIKSVEQSGLPATNAFDNNAANAWASSNTIPAWIGYTFAAPVDVAELAVTSWDDATFWNLAPTNFTLEASNDGFATAGILAYAANGVSWSGRNVTKLFNVGAAAGNLEATKAVTYVPVGPPLLLSTTKAVMYVITGPPRQVFKTRLLKSIPLGLNA